MGFFVDFHSHVVPSDDDGVHSVGEGIALCRDAQARGTAVLFATPHVWPHLVLTDERERAIRAAYADVAKSAGLELRLGFELTPTARLLGEELRRYELEGTNAVLIEIPFVGGYPILVDVCEHASNSDLEVVIAHPERTEAVLERPARAQELVDRGWLLQVNATSLLGRHGAEIEALAWQLIDDNLVALVASDGHRATRPPFLDEAYRAVVARVGDIRARSLFDGSALGVTAALPLPSRAAARGA